jgi:protein involved in temperature-dependent protein secretion
VKVELDNGTNGEMFLPSLYANTWKNSDDQVRLGRSVDWRDLGDDLFVGEGSRLFWMNGKDMPLLDIKTISFKRES